MSKVKGQKPEHNDREKFKGLLEQTHSLRLHMALLTTIAGIFAFLANYFLLNQMLVRNLSWRYSVVILLSYAFFLFLIKLWLHYIFPKMSFFSDDSSTAADLLDPALLNLNLSAADFNPQYQGGGGGFSGGGASGSWSGDSIASPGLSSVPADSVKSGSSILKESSSALDLDLDGDAVAVVVPVVVILAIVAIALSILAVMFSIVYFAPAILAEIAFEVAVSLGLYRGLKTALKQSEGGSGRWVSVAIKKTALYVVTLLVCNLIFCQVILHYYPDISRISEIFPGRFP